MARAFGGALAVPDRFGIQTERAATHESFAKSTHRISDKHVSNVNAHSLFETSTLARWPVAD